MEGLLGLLRVDALDAEQHQRRPDEVGELRTTWYYGDASSVGLIVSSGDEATQLGAGNVTVTPVRALAVVGMSASALRYQPAPDRNETLREQIVALAQRHKRYGAEMICLKLRQAGHLVNQKRVDRLYALEKLQVRRRRRKKIQPGERQPLIRPGAANEVWSMDFVFDRIASGRVLKCLAIVDDAKRERVLQQATEIAVGDLGIIPLYHQHNLWATRKGVAYTARTDERTLAHEFRPQ